MLRKNKSRGIKKVKIVDLAASLKRALLSPRLVKQVAKSVGLGRAASNV